MSGSAQASGGGALDRAMTLHRAGQLPAALTAYQDLLAADPTNADAMHLTGVLVHQMGRTSTGIAFIEQAIALNPRAPMFHRNMAELRKSAGDHRRAAAHFAQAITLNPRDAVAHAELGFMRAAGGDHRGAVFGYRAALQLDPDMVSAHCNLGVSLQELGDDDSARDAYRQAIALRPDFTPALNNLAAMLWTDEQVDAAIDLLRRAVAADPTHPESRINLGQLLLHQGDLGEGWTLLEARRALGHALHPPEGAREWTGPGDHCRRLLVCAEQGLGDELMFASCLPDLIAAQPDTSLVVECDPRLAALFGRSFAGCEIRPYRLTAARLRANRRDWLAQAPVDAFVPAGTLPLHFRSDQHDFPSKIGYLTADAGRVAHWRAWLDSLAGDDDQRMTVGLCWRSGVSNGQRDRVTIPLTDWTPLLASSRLRVINLQYGDAGSALADFCRSAGASVHTPPGLDLFDDLDDIAALISALDHVVSAATSVCEMAGALGRPTWRLVRGIDWSMLGAERRRPWHPNTTLIRGSGHRPANTMIDEVLTKLVEDIPQKLS